MGNDLKVPIKKAHRTQPIFLLSDLILVLPPLKITGLPARGRWAQWYSRRRCTERSPRPDLATIQQRSWLSVRLHARHAAEPSPAGLRPSCLIGDTEQVLCKSFQAAAAPAAAASITWPFMSQSRQMQD